MIINPNNRNTRRPIYLDDGLLHQISVIDCILMRLRLNRLSCWRDNLKLCTKYRLRIISAFQNSYAFNYCSIIMASWVAAKILPDYITIMAYFLYLISTISCMHYVWSSYSLFIKCITN